MDKLWEEGTQDGILKIALYNKEHAVAAKILGCNRPFRNRTLKNSGAKYF